MSQKRFSREGFKPLAANQGVDGGNPRDVTIDIPLTTVTSRTGARKPAMSPSGYEGNAELPQESPNEKSGLFHRRGPGGRRRKIETRGREATDPEDGTMTAMGKIYTKVLNFSIITRYFLYVLPVAIALAVPIVVGATAAPTAAIGGVRLVWFFTWIEVAWVSLWVSKLVAQMLPPIFMFIIGIVSPGVRKYALVLKSLEIPLSLVGWAVTSLATFLPVMTHNPDFKGPQRHWQTVIQSLLAAAVVATLILLVEKLLVQLISISYHQTQFSEKIKESKRNIYLLGLLYDASRTLFPEYSPEFMAEDFIINDSLNLSSLGGGSGNGTGHKRSGSATPMRLLHNVGRVGDAVIGKFGNIAQEVTGKQVFNPNSAHAIVVEALEKTASSEALARRIWMSLVMEGKDALYEEDIVDVLGANRQNEAVEAFGAIDNDGNGDISMDEMVLAVTGISRERKAIAHSMHDVDQAIHVLDNLLCTVAFVIVIFIFVAFLNRSFVTTLATAGTALLSLSFVFAATAQEVLGSCIFLFVKHPFDVGDRVDIGGDMLLVERISLLFTVFRGVKDFRTKQVPNIVLNGVWIENITRSQAMREQITLNIHADTSLEDIQLLKNEMVKFVVDKENSRDFQPDVNVSVLAMTDLSKLELQVDVVHKSNWSNEAIRASRRSKLMCALVLALRRVPVYGPGAGGAGAGDPANPTYSVAISNEEAEANKKKFTETKEGKRMVPSKSAAPPVAPMQTLNSPLSSRATGADYLGRYESKASKRGNPEAKVIDTLNARPPAIDPVRDNQTEYFRKETAAAAAVNNDISPASTPDEQRHNDIEDVRGLLHQESTRGKRKNNMSTSGASSSAAGPRAASPTSYPAIHEGQQYLAPTSSTPGFTPLDVPTIRQANLPPPRSDSRTGTSGNNPVEYHEYNYAPPPLSVASQPQSPASPNIGTAAPYSPQGSYQSNNPYARSVSQTGDRSGGGASYSTTPIRRPVGGNGNPGRSDSPAS